MNRYKHDTRRKGPVWYDTQSNETRKQIRQEIKYRFHKYRLLGHGIELSKAKVRDDMDLSMHLIAFILKKKKPSEEG